jgi:uncharacterized CHY-type Zn-finger protein
MKLTEHFDDFLKDTVNLNQSRIEQLEKRVETISSFLCKNDYAPRIWRFTAQGSWAHKSIIKPPKNKDFDADLLAIIGEVEGWRAKDYINELYYVFRNNQIYADKVSRGTRCVVLNYKGDFHLDVVPCIQIIEGESKRFWVCNRCEDEFEETASESYTAWLAEKNLLTGRNQLQKVIRLLKYLRDIKGTFSAKSILLTTLVGMQIDDEVSSSNYFSDLPTSLKNIVNWLDNFLQARPSMPVIENPVLSGEHFNRHWNQEKYENFRSKIHQYRDWIDDAYAEPDRDESIGKWRRVFGDDFAKGEVLVKAASFSASVLHRDASSVELVAAIRTVGKSILACIPKYLPHIEKVPWQSNVYQLPVSVQAGEYTRENGEFIRELESGTVMQKHRSIRFEAHLFLGLPRDFFVKWRVVNTGEEAARANRLRGTFYGEGDGKMHWESTLYTGVHWVEAFVVNRRDNKCVGQSQRFFVVIE